MKFRFYSTNIVVAIAAISATLSLTLSAQNKLVGYYPYWMEWTLPAESIPFEHLTHINHAFAWPDENGEILMPGGLIYPQLNETVHAEGKQILISLGGAGTSFGFSPMAADPSARANFLDNLVAFIHDNDYDGADLDWEFPGSDGDRSSLTTLVSEMRQRFDSENPEWLITMAVNPGNWYGQWHDFDALEENIDWFSAMCYDFHGSWTSHAGHNAPIYQPPNDFDGATEVGMDYMHLTRGVSKDKLLVGMPFYGKEFNATELYGSSTGGDLYYDYSTIYGFLNNGWNYVWDDFSKVPYLQNSDQTKLITYDDSISIAIKAEWIVENGYAGGMIWALGQDVVTNSTPLLDAAGEVLLGANSIDDLPTLPLETHLLGNYPNPFNPSTTIRFQLSSPSTVVIQVYDIQGRQVAELAEAKRLMAGNHEITWDGNNTSGQAVASGVYIYRLNIPPSPPSKGGIRGDVSGSVVQSKKMILIR